MDKRRLRRWLARLAVVLGVVLLGGLAYGPCFAWLPVMPGFKTLTMTRARIAYRDPPGVVLDPKTVDGALADLERELGLTFSAPAQFVLCDSWSDFKRFTPWLRVSHGLGAITLPIGLVSYVTPVVRNRADLLTFIQHESAHVLLYQRASISHRLEMERQAWFVEGIAVHFGNPGAYLSWAEFRQQAAGMDVAASIEPPPCGPRRLAGGASFSYSACGFFVAHLIQRFGEDRLRDFIRRYQSDPAAYRAEFAASFGVEFSAEVRAFALSDAEPRTGR